jgi:hypothetical protein
LKEKKEKELEDLRRERIVGDPVEGLGSEEKDVEKG